MSSGVTSSPWSSLTFGVLGQVKLLSLSSAAPASAQIYGPPQRAMGRLFHSPLGLIPSMQILVQHSSLSPNVTSAVTPYAQKFFLFGSIKLCVVDFSDCK